MKCFALPVGLAITGVVLTGCATRTPQPPVAQSMFHKEVASVDAGPDWQVCQHTPLDQIRSDSDTANAVASSCAVVINEIQSSVRVLEQASQVTSDGYYGGVLKMLDADLVTWSVNGCTTMLDSQACSDTQVNTLALWTSADRSAPGT